MSFPNIKYNNEDLGGNAIEGLRTKLTTAITSIDTIIPVESVSNFLEKGYITIGSPGIDFEIIYYEEKDATGLYFDCKDISNRGVNGTTGYAHQENDYVRHCYIALYHNRITETLANLQIFSRDQRRLSFYAQADTTGISQWDAVCLNQAQVFTKTNPNYFETSLAVGIAIEDIPINQWGIAIEGLIENASWNWTPGGLLYLDTLINGGITQTIPSSGYRICCGWAVKKDSILFRLIGEPSVIL